ncbi:MAG: DUF4382 domain-containing protein [Cecembia sp.]
MKKAKLFLLTLFLCFLSCSDEVERNNSLVNVFIIGAPGEFNDIFLEILGVDIKTTGSRGTDNTESVFFPNTQVDKRVNIATLTANSQFLIGRGEMPANAITEIILRLGDDNFVTVGNNRIPIQINNESASNPIFQVSFPLISGISHDIFLDFDPFRSFIVTPGLEPRVELVPFVRPFMSLDKGRANGTISPPNQRVGIFTFEENGEWVSSTGSQAPSGNFSIRGLQENKLHRVLILPFNESYLPDTLDSVSVNIREITQLGTINLRLIEE